jgi:hypothetical protein
MPARARSLGHGRVGRAATIVLSILVLIGVPILVVVLASGERAETASGRIAPAGSDPHRPAAPFFANAGDGVRPAGIGCTSEGPSVVRALTHLDVFADGARVTVPGDIGRLARCTYWVHTDTADGVVTITSPVRRTFTLGNLFDIWGAPLTSTQALGFRLGAGRRVRAFVDGRPVSGDPRTIQLRHRREIALVIGRRPARVPARFAFPGGG